MKLEGEPGCGVGRFCGIGLDEEDEAAVAEVGAEFFADINVAGGYRLIVVMATNRDAAFLQGSDGLAAGKLV